MEQIRIVKEMREHDRQQLLSRGADVSHGLRPRYMVWENVPGALSSGKPKGADFQIVLTEIVKIVKADAPPVPMPEKGKWDKSGCIYDEMGKWSIAWRVHDAQFWGVPQRRKRISLVADFGGLSAPEILFERKGLQWNPGEGQEERKATANAVGKSTFDSGELYVMEGNGQRPSHVGKGYRNDGIGYTLNTTERQIVAYRKTSHPRFKGEGQGWEETKVSDTLNTFDIGESRTPILIFEAHAQDCRYKPLPNVCETISAKYKSPCGNAPLALQNGMVRYITPTECERLQGFPDGWTDIGEWTDSNGKKRKMSDGQRYKALGNSLALPFWEYVAKRICAQYERNPTVGSLFDGIGGFPLAFLKSGAETVWGSEVDEFCIAVTKAHFPGD